MTRRHSPCSRTLAALSLAGLVFAACGSDETADPAGSTTGGAPTITSVGSETGEPNEGGGGGDTPVVAATEPDVTDAPGAEVAGAEVAGAEVAGAEVAGAEAAGVTGTTCGADNFDVSVNDVERTDGYPDPELAVTCDDTTMTVASNNIIAYEFVQITPNDLGAQDYTFELPVAPEERSTPGAIGLGTTGVAINGVVLFAAFEAPRDGYRDPLLDGLLDFCNGHTAPGAVYHYHARPDCILADPTEPGTVVGYGLDGYEIVVPTACVDEACSSTEQIVSSYQKINGDDLGAFTGWEFVDGSGDLDVCNGRTDADGVYRYYATDTFPYLPFCFHGVTAAAVGDFDGSEPAGGPPA